MGGLLLWAAHFFVAYGIASIWPGTLLARVLVAAVTLLLLVVVLWLLRLGLQRARAAGDETDRWLAGLELAGLGIAALAIAYQGLPTIF